MNALDSVVTADRPARSGNAGETIVSLANVGVAFGSQRRLGGSRFWAMEDVSLDLRRGETLGVIGRNGAGKSTLLRVIAGVLQPDRGVMRREPGRYQLLSLGMGFMPHLSGRENAILGGLMMGMRHRDISTRLPAILEFSELGDFFDQPINTYSTGMQLRLAFSVAIQVEPDVLLLDEVLGVGDAAFREKSGEVLKRHISGDTTVVYVSHDDAKVREICDRAIWIEDGRSLALGAVGEVLARYHAAARDGSPAPAAD